MISNNLKKQRLERGMSISELARRSKLNRMTIYNIENQKVIPNLETAMAISSILGNKIDEIFFTQLVNHELQMERRD